MSSIKNLNRTAFTLIELLVVLCIIAILTGMLAAGVMSALSRATDTQTRVEIGQLEAALASFRSEFKLDYPPPSYLILREDMQYGKLPPTDPNYQRDRQSQQFLLKAFGRTLGANIGNPPPGMPNYIDWNGDGIFNGPWYLEGEQCLVFYTSGIPNPKDVAAGYPPGPQGFSMSNVNPAYFPPPPPPPLPPLPRRGPFYDFKPSRLVSGVGGFFHYRDPYLVGSQPASYAYFSSQGLHNDYNITDCQNIGAIPYWVMVQPMTFTSPDTYQIVSAGRDGKFGGGLWSPRGGAVGNGADDLANFSKGILGAGQH